MCKNNGEKLPKSACQNQLLADYNLHVYCIFMIVQRTLLFENVWQLETSE